MVPPPPQRACEDRFRHRFGMAILAQMLCSGRFRNNNTCNVTDLTLSGDNAHLLAGQLPQPKCLSAGPLGSIGTRQA
jgi:hypothetical protein